jgi:hypothetical protein
MSEIKFDGQMTPRRHTVLDRARPPLPSHAEPRATVTAPSTATSADADLTALVGAGGDVPCECEHPDEPCDHLAEHRVTPQCPHPGCEGAQGVWLLCNCCLQTWLEQAEPGTITSRPLR